MGLHERLIEAVAASEMTEEGRVRQLNLTLNPEEVIEIINALTPENVWQETSGQDIVGDLRGLMDTENESLATVDQPFIDERIAYLNSKLNEPGPEGDRWRLAYRDVLKGLGR